MKQSGVIGLVTGALIVGSLFGSIGEGAHAIEVIPVPIVVQQEPQSECVPQPPSREARIVKVVQAMEAIAQTESPQGLRKLLEVHGEPYTAEDWAGFIVDRAEENGLDPLVLVSIVWKESRFSAWVEGDRKKGRARSCGATGVRTDYKGRPTCKQLMDPNFAIGWTAQHLAKFPGACDGDLCLSRYNGGKYEVRVWRTTDWMRRQLL